MVGLSSDAPRLKQNFSSPSFFFSQGVFFSVKAFLGILGVYFEPRLGVKLCAAGGTSARNAAVGGSAGSRIKLIKL